MILAAVFGLCLALYHAYRRSEFHDQMDQGLIGILVKQDAVQLEQRCLAAGFAKAEAEKDAAGGQASR